MSIGQGLADTRPTSHLRSGPVKTCFVGIGPRIRASIRSWIDSSHTDKMSLRNLIRPVGWIIEKPLPAGSGSGKVKRSVDRFPEGLQHISECQELAAAMNVPLWDEPIKIRNLRVAPGGPVWTMCPRFWRFWLDIMPEVAWMGTYRTLIPEELFAHFDTVNRMWINTHPYVAHGNWVAETAQEHAMKGCTPYEGALATGVKKLAIYAHFIDSTFDSGNYIAQSTPRNLWVIDPQQRIGEGRGKSHRQVPYSASEMRTFIWFNHAQMAEPTAELLRALAYPIWHHLRSCDLGSSRRRGGAEFRAIHEGRPLFDV